MGPVTFLGEWIWGSIFLFKHNTINRSIYIIGNNYMGEQIVKFNKYLELNGIE